MAEGLLLSRPKGGVLAPKQTKRKFFMEVHVFWCLAGTLKGWLPGQEDWAMKSYLYVLRVWGTTWMTK